MKRLIDLINEYKCINECGSVGCGEYHPRPRASRKFQEQERKPLSKEEKLNAAKSNFAANIVDNMLKNVKGTSTYRAKERLEKACEHLCERAQSMDGGVFVTQFAKYIEAF